MRAALITCVLVVAVVASVLALPFPESDKEIEALKKERKQEDQESHPFKRAQDTEYKRLDGVIEAMRENEKEEDGNPLNKRGQEDMEYKRSSTCSVGDRVDAQCSSNLKVWDISNAIRYAFCNFDGDQTTVTSAVNEITNKIPDVTFQETTCSDSTHHVSVQSSDSGCYSHIGRTCGDQKVNLQASACTTVGVTIHEFLHTLGMSHVQQRSDSADYVDKIEANVMDGFVSQFAPNPNMCLECTYLPCSVMHYGAYAFSVSKGTSPTLQPRDPLNLITMGIQKGLTAYDICTINREYGLTDARTCDSPSGCKFGTDFDGEFACDCMCASGLTGSDCGTFQSGTTGIALDSGETHTLSTDGLTYEENQQLNYMVYSTDESLHIKYTFREMVIEDDADCYWDQFNYWANTSVLYCPYTICGDHSGFSGVTSSNFFYAFFHSDDFWNERGFVIDFEVVA